ncbi:MAG: YdcF family protein [Kiritimatiellae bacterium]|nr:YdcF family protein [Kiritimatiellia bacterium]
MLLNKIAGFILNPLMLGIILIAASVLCQLIHRRRASLALGVSSILWFWLWSTHALYIVLGYGLEKSYPPQLAASMPKADAIVVLGGGMGSNTNLPYAEMGLAADRAWHAARLYHAGKAPVVIPSGGGEEFSTVPLLLDLGVPRSAIQVEPDARNTEENALLVEKLVNGLPNRETNRVARVLLVTSAWHMRRSLLNFSHTGLEVIPAATDHEATTQKKNSLSLEDFLPSYDKFHRNNIMFKEWLGFYLYKVKYKIRG